MPHPRSPGSYLTLRVTSLAVLALVAAIFPAGTSAADPPTPEAADQVVVRYRAGTTKAERERVARDYGLTKVHGTANGRTDILVAEGRSPATARRQLAKDPSVVAVSPNSWRDLDDEITDEALFPYLWGLDNTGQSVNAVQGTADIDIDGLEALRIERGDPSVVVAVIDDGIDFTHPDLAGRAWVNQAEAEGLPGVDDDSNGYIDDVNGWDFCQNDATVGPEGDDWHGTHVSGTIAASLNGQGIVGVAPGISLMSLRAFAGGQSCDTGDLGIIAAIDYAASFGVPIINASWGGSDPSLALEAAVSDADHTLLVAAAGNGGQNMDGGGQRSYPAAYTDANVLAVAAVDQSGQLADFSNYGATSVDIAAPGVNIVSAVPGGYGMSAGTSMAAPHVAGIAALALSAVASPLTTAQLKARVLGAGVPLASTTGKTVTGDLANALRAVDTVGPVTTPINQHGINVGSVIGSTVSTTMTWPAAVDALTGVRDYLIQRSLNGGAFTTIAASTTSRSFKQLMTFGVPNRFKLFARDGAGNYGASAVGPTIKASLLQDGTSLATYSGTWSRVSLSSASNGRLHRSTTGGSTVTFRTTARAIAVVGRRGPLNGKAKVYVDGVYRTTISLYQSKWQSKVVVFNTTWTTAAIHSVKLVVVGGTGRVDVDAFVFLR